jgi:acyl-coenzyme A synthetase/AMP-(fatty) acid ligase
MPKSLTTYQKLMREAKQEYDALQKLGWKVRADKVLDYALPRPSAAVMNKAAARKKLTEE